MRLIPHVERHVLLAQGIGNSTNPHSTEGEKERQTDRQRQRRVMETEKRDRQTNKETERHMNASEDVHIQTHDSKTEVLTNKQQPLH